MMLRLHGRPSDVDYDVEVFAYQLAEMLHKTIGEIEAMPHEEFVNWSAYLTAKTAITHQSPQGG